MKFFARLIVSGGAIGVIFGSVIVVAHTPRAMAIWEAPIASPSTDAIKQAYVVKIDPNHSKIRYDDDPYPYYIGPIRPDVLEVCSYPLIETPNFKEITPKRPDVKFDSSNIKLFISDV